MKLTKKKAKRLTLLVWDYLYKHPEIDEKTKLPAKILEKVKNFKCACPLCEIFQSRRTFSRIECPECPLTKANNTCGHSATYPYKNYYDIWAYGDTDQRIIGAKGIYDIVKAWEV